MSPDVCIVLLTCGVLLIYWELNRPGMILPGACGLLVTLLAAAALRPAASPVSLSCLLAGSTLLLLSVRLRLPLVLQAAAALAFIIGFYSLRAAAASGRFSGMHAAVALACGGGIGLGSLFLTGFARRARRNKGLD